MANQNRKRQNQTSGRKPADQQAKRTSSKGPQRKKPSNSGSKSTKSRYRQAHEGKRPSSPKQGQGQRKSPGRKQTTASKKRFRLNFFLAKILVIVIFICWGIHAFHKLGDSRNTEVTIHKAQTLAAGYDYDSAINLLKTIDDYKELDNVNALIKEYEETKASCVPVDVDQVPHIFYHSLLNDPKRAFDVDQLGQLYVDDMNAWMTTIEEFDRITKSLYENGYVYVKLRDLVVETTDEDGNTVFEKNEHLMLPPGKKAIVLSIDDLSYYHCYEKGGFPDKLVLDKNGDVKCHYINSEDKEEIGDFDVVPRLNSFLEEHPDGAYHGARGLIAMTGYNGVFGYRTDADYEYQKNLQSDQKKWLKDHPDFNRDKEIAEATKIADVIKAEGWEFASHTWGHQSVTNKTADQLERDNEKWVENVENIVGPVDTIIFAHGNDIGSESVYEADNPKYRMYYDAGYRFFCNVDSASTAWFQLTKDYVRQARINLDGYTLYRALRGKTKILNDFFDVDEVFDDRRPTPVNVTNQKD